VVARTAATVVVTLALWHRARGYNFHDRADLRFRYVGPLGDHFTLSPFLKLGVLLIFTFSIHVNAHCANLVDSFSQVASASIAYSRTLFDGLMMFDLELGFVGIKRRLLT
jgi:hypothetical protein